MWIRLFHFHKGSGELTYDQTHRQCMMGRYFPPRHCQPWSIRLSNYHAVLWGLLFSSTSCPGMTDKLWDYSDNRVRLKPHCMSWVYIVVNVRSDKVEPGTNCVDLELFFHSFICRVFSVTGEFSSTHTWYYIGSVCLAKSAHFKIKPEILPSCCLQRL